MHTNAVETNLRQRNFELEELRDKAKLVDDEITIKNKDQRKLRRAFKRLQNEYYLVFTGRKDPPPKSPITPKEAKDDPFCFMNSLAMY